MAEWLPEWRFAAMAPGQITENPVQGQFFTSAADMPERLVREAIQNSMDAALPDQRVRVRFAFSGNRDALQPREASQYLDGFEDHWQAVAVETMRSTALGGDQQVAEQAAIYRANRLFDEPLQWLTIEDFGTHGLTGDIEANGAREDGNNFWGFFRQVGVSTKDEDAAGSWGLGKWVFPDASQVNSFIAVTRRHGESHPMVMGLSMLKTHELDGKRYPAYGHFAQADDADDQEWFQLPVRAEDSPQFLAHTVRRFRLERGTQSGLSIIIFWPHDELTPSTLARAVVTQYFYPILAGELEVVIEHPEEEVRVIDSDLIEDELSWIEESDRDDESEQSLRGLLGLTRWAMKHDRGAGVIRIPLPTNRRNVLKEDDSNIDVEHLRQQFVSGERLAFEVHSEVQRTSAHAPSRQSCRIFVEQAPELDKGHDYFVRGRLRIPNIDHLSSQRARALLVVDGESELGHLLRDAEGPAHVDWHDKAERVKEKWARGASTRISDIRRAPLRIVQALVERPAERQMDALADLFPADVAREGSPTSPRGRGSGETLAPIVPPLSNPSPIQLRQVQGGFSVSSRDQRGAAGDRWRVRFAYELARGGKNAAFTRFERGVKDGVPDFSLGDSLRVDAMGCSYEVVRPNELILTAERPQFEAAILGFDTRDVLVELKPEEATEPGIAVNQVKGVGS